MNQMKQKLRTMLVMSTLSCVAFFATLTPAAGERGPELVNLSGIKGGLIVYLDGSAEIATADLLVAERYRVQGLFRDEKRVQLERAAVQAKGCYGSVWVKHLQGNTLPYVDNLVNLIVAADYGSIPTTELFRVLAPNGVLLTKKEINSNDSGFSVSASGIKGGWKMAVKPWPSGMDEWTHWMHGPDNNPVSSDTMSEIPRSLQWRESPVWQKSHEQAPALDAMVTAKGRLFYIMDEAAPGVGSMPDKWFLTARDAFNGIQLWKRPIKEWGGEYWMKQPNQYARMFSGTYQVFRRLVAVDDQVFATLGMHAPVSALDAATGKIIRSYAGTEKTFEILCHENTLLLAVNHALDNKSAEPDVSIMAVDRTTGEILWESKGYKGFKGGRALREHSSPYVDVVLTLGKEHVFFVNKEDVFALDLVSGKRVWSTNRSENFDNSDGHSTSMAYYNNILFVTQVGTAKSIRRGLGKQSAIVAIDAVSGKKLWSRDTASLAFSGVPPDIFINRGLVWILDGETRSFVGLDPATGAKKDSIDGTLIASGFHHNCYPNKLTHNFLIYGRNKGVEYFDFNSKAGQRTNWVKGSCRYGIMPANGMIYAPSHFCGCYATAKLNGMVALAKESNQVLSPSGVDAVENGDAFGKKYGAELSAGNDEWPTYRHDNERSGSQAAPLAENPRVRWTVKPGTSLTPPVIANKKIFVSSKDAHRVFCLDENDGHTLWSYDAGGTVDSPPSYYRGRLVFGCSDGSVYCLDADSGILIWRFQAAPEDRQIMEFGHLESAWPVFGSVLLHEDRVYCTAGRSSYLDSGIFLYILDLNTGQPIKTNRSLPDTTIEGEMSRGAHADILVGDGNRMHLRSIVFDMQTLDIVSAGSGDRRLPDNDEVDLPYLMPLGGFLDDTMFNSAYWMFGQTSGNLLAIDAHNVYGIKLYGVDMVKSHVHKNFIPGQSKCVLFATGKHLGQEELTKDGTPPNASHKTEKIAWRAFNSKKKESEPLWSEPLAIRANSIVAGPNRLYVAGVRDRIDEEDPWGHLDGRKGGLLLICSNTNGETQMQIELASPPIFDGMAAANGRLFVSCKDGSLVCLGE